MEIIFAEGRSFISKLIMWFTSKKGYPKISHVAIRYSPPEEEWLVEASFIGVVPEWWKFFKKRYKKLYRFKCTAKGCDEALDNLISQCGHSNYDFLELLGFAIKIICNKICYRIKNPLGSKRRYICTELVQNFCKELNLPMPTDESMSPADLYEFCCKNKYFEQL
jgi:hypothetical protein